MSTGTSLPKWQLALVFGAPVAIGLSYMYYKNRTSNNSKIPDKQDNHNARQDGGNKSLPIDDSTSANNPEVQLGEAQMYKDKGNKQFKLGNYKKAVFQYEKAIEVCPKQKSGYIAVFYQNKAAAYEQLENYIAAEEDCTKALELNPKYTKALLRRARALEKMGELESALDDVSTASIFESFYNPTTLMLADRILEQLGKRHAEEDLKKRKFILPSKHFLRNYIASFSKDPVFSRIEHIDEEDTPQFFKRPLQALKDEDYKSIKSICADIVQSPEFLTLPSSKMEIVLLQATFDMFLGPHDGVFKAFDYILNDEDSSKDVKINALIKRATLRMQLNCPQMAYNDFDEAITMDKECCDIYHHRGQLHLLANNLEAAKSDFETAILSNPDFVPPVVKRYYVIYRVLLVKDDYKQIEQTVVDFEPCTEKYPDYAECDILYAQMLADMGHCGRSETYFLKALKKDPDNASIYVHLGLLQMQQTRNIDKTVKYIKQAIELDTKCELAYETLGSIEVQRGNLEEAIRLFDEALRLAHTYRQLTHLYSLKDAAKIQLVIKNRLENM